MAKRFGRNQKRKLQSALSEAIDVKEGAVRSLNRMKSAVAEQEKKHLEEIRAARMARDTIRIDVDALVDPMDRNIRIRARFDNFSKQGPELYSAIDISRDTLLRDSEIERFAFITLVGERVAEHALTQIMRHWRSR